MDRAIKVVAEHMNFDYNAQPKETVCPCNICDSKRSILISNKDRYGFHVTAHLCLNCGVVYLSPRMNQEGYTLFYEKFYRPLVSAYLQRKIDRTTIRAEQEIYSQDIYNWISPFLLSMKKELRIIDIGGSTGTVAHTFQQNLISEDFSVEVSVLDPSPDELAVAKKLGLKTILGFIENFEVMRDKWDIILLCQTIDHLLDVKKSFNIIRQMLADDGYLFVDIVDWEYVVRKKTVQDAIKIDHPFNFTRKTVMPFLEGVGFEVVSEATLPDGHLIGFLCKKADTKKSIFSKRHADFLLSLVKEKQAATK